jgi:hypothetical protein
MAISQSELGVGDSTDIYPGLYMQHTLDELQTICASKPPKILLSPLVCEDVDVEGRLQTQATPGPAGTPAEADTETTG